jgi:hypothetical protein
MVIIQGLSSINKTKENYIHISCLNGKLLIKNDFYVIGLLAIILLCTKTGQVKIDVVYRCIAVSYNF